MTHTTRQGRTGQWGFDYVKSVVEGAWGCILEEFNGFRDVGIDATIIDMHAGFQTPYRLDIQVRTSECYAARREGFSVTVSQNHRRSWAESIVPLFLVCVDAAPRRETKAYWRLITSSDAGNETIFVSRKNVFGPTSRGEILAAIRRAAPKNLPPVEGTLLGCALNVGLRPTAREWYLRNLLQSSVESPYFGPITFTWHGWRHITRNHRSRLHIHSCLLLLPSVKAILQDPMVPMRTRRLPVIIRGAYIYERTLLVFERTVSFWSRSPALVRVVVKQADKMPQDWRYRIPDSPERSRICTFYSVEELSH